ncbi:MAG: hypothetical protein JJE22_05380 [Bacteroidia bacterium]|nr:hypothetical protein [Bacteroidia bacterium]
MFIRIPLITILGCVAIPILSQAQINNFSSYAAYAEKIYLQLDNKVYTTDQTIWFKAIVANAGDHTPGKLSGLLYAELIDPNENIIEKKLIKIEKGIGDGFFQLTPSYTYGVYQIRAYTEWNKNFGSNFFFKEYIIVSGPEGKKEANSIKSLTVIEEQQNIRRLKVQLDPAANEGIPGKSVTFVLSQDARKDTLSIKKNKGNQYLLDYNIPVQSEFVTLQVKTENQTSYSKTIILDTNYLDLQFFPESGELVQGLTAVIGFKAVDYTGNGKQIKGEIVNDKEEVIVPFTSNRLGMGSLKIERIDSAEKYSVKIFSQEGNELQKHFKLPAIAAKGNTLMVRKKDDKIILKAQSNYLAEDSISIRASCRGINYFDFKGKLKKGSLEFSFPANTLPEGIIDFTVMTNLKTPVAERLYFNERPESRMNISVAADKQEYIQREKTEMIIETKDANGEPVPANVSLLVFNKSQQGRMLDYHQNILSYFLLSSDLKGEIENPGFYFTKDSNRFDDLDALLLTQGWRKYNYTRDMVTFRFQPEASLTVSGSVKGGLSDKKIIKDAELTMMTFGKPPSFGQQKTDSLGRFSFPLEDDYSQSLKVLIQSANKRSKKENYLITLDKKESPPISFNHIRSAEKPDRIIKAYITQSLASKKTEDSFRIATEGITLQEVIVKSRILSPQQKLVTEKYGEPKVILDGQTIRDKEAKWSYGLYSVLLFNFPDKIKITRFGNGQLYASLHNSEPTLVVIDGIPVKYYEYNMIPGIPPAEVKSFELIEYANNFKSLYCEAVPEFCNFDSPTHGNVIAIYTYAGKGIYGVRPTIGLNKMEVPVFAATREFYAPKYDQPKPEDLLKPDLRNLIHWQPNINKDSTGRATTTFYNLDNTGTMQIVIEAISENGEIGYQELFFDVRKRN